MQVPRLPPIEAGMTVKRPAKFGGDVHYESYETLEADFVSGAMHRRTSRRHVRTP